MHLAIRRSSYCRIFLQCYSVKREITCTDLWCSLHELFPIWHLGKKSELVILQNIHSLKQEKNHHLIQQQLTIFKSHNILRSTIVKSCNIFTSIQISIDMQFTHLRYTVNGGTNLWTEWYTQYILNIGK